MKGIVAAGPNSEKILLNAIIIIERISRAPVYRTLIFLL